MLARGWILVLAALAATAASKRISKSLADDAEKYLLPWNIRPEHYNLTLYTNIDKFVDGNEDTFVFSGVNVITINILYGDVDVAVLHTYDDVNITGASVVPVGSDSTKYTVTVGSYDPETNKQNFLVDPPLKNYGKYNLTIAYSGRNTNSLRGFYRSSYEDGGKTRWLLTTHFESFGARQAFPSFDEPEYKATYQLTVYYSEALAQDGYVAHSNTDIESEQVRDGVHITRFQKTPRPLSSYLVAFIIAPFVSSPVPTYFNSSFNGENGTKAHHTIGQPKYFSPRQDLLSQVAGPAALNTITKLVGVGYGFNKMENAGIPDFAPGAMENWGLVTFRETAIFWDEQSGTTAQKQSVASVITHEFGHQWFGDLVTLHWWTDLWLNEGFATYFATHAANEYREPTLNTSDWDLIGQFVTGTLQKGAFVTDAKPTSRPLTAEAYDRDTIDGYFDGISYDKGGSVLRMWQNALGPNIFYNGLNRYLTSQEQSIGTPEILLAGFDGAIDALPADQRPKLPGLVKNIFAGWHRQAGYPVLNAVRKGGSVTITQKRFLSAPGDDSNRWTVPLTYSTDLENNFNNTRAVAYLSELEDSTTLQLQKPNAAWVVINNQETGFYRVNYDQDNWNALLKVVNDSSTAGQIHPYNRAQILDDAANLGASTHEHYLGYDTVLDLLMTLKNEREPIVWFTGLRIMQDLHERFSSDLEIQKKLDAMFLHLIEPTFNALSLEVKETDTHVEKLLRAKMADFACFLGLPACQKEAKNLFSSGSMHPDVREVVLCEGVKLGDSKVWEAALIKAKNTFGPIRDELLSSLTCTNDLSLLTRLRDVLLNEKEINDLEAMTILKKLQMGSRALLAFEIANARRWRSKSSSIGQFINSLAETLTSDNARSLTYALTDDVISTIDNNSRWLQQKTASIVEWIERNDFSL